MRKFSQRSLNVDITYDDALGLWVAEKEVQIKGEFKTEEEAIKWSETPIDAPVPETASRRRGPAENTLPIERPINPAEEVEVMDDELDLNLDNPNEVKASSLLNTILAEVDHFIPSKVSRIRDQVEFLLGNKDLNSVLSVWDANSDDKTNLDKVLNHSTIKALQDTPEGDALYTNLTNLKNRVVIPTTQSSSSLTHQVYSKLVKTQESAEQLGLSVFATRTHQRKVLVSELRLSEAEATSALREFYAKV